LGTLIVAIRDWALGLGGWGLFIIALLDSSFLSFPQVNDALVLVLSARDPGGMIVYVIAATIGSVAGCFLLYLVGRRGGETFLRRRFNGRHVDRAMRWYQRWGVLAVFVPALLPPPTPFKLTVLMSGAAGVHPAAFAAAVGLGRGLRYLVQGYLAVAYGDRALSVLRTHGLELVVVAVAASVLVGGGWWLWTRGSRVAHTSIAPRATTPSTVHD
jgi:membrane protein YqaA with SNARE-associated domain